MIAMRPIAEPAVVDSLNGGRFSGEVEGYVVMENANYLGHMLYKVENGVTYVLDCGLTDHALVDGGVRACVAAGEDCGADRFWVNAEEETLRRWREVFLKNEAMPARNDTIFHPCK